MSQRWHGPSLGRTYHGIGHQGGNVALRHAAFRPGVGYAGRGYRGHYPRYGYGAYYRRSYPYAVAGALVGGLTVGAFGSYGGTYYYGYPGYPYTIPDGAYYDMGYGEDCVWQRVQNRWGRFVSVPVCR